METNLILVINTSHGEVRLEYNDVKILPKEGVYLDLRDIDKHNYFKDLTDTKKKQLFEINGDDTHDEMYLYTSHYMHYLYPNKYDVLIVLHKDQAEAIEEMKQWYSTN